MKCAALIPFLILLILPVATLAQDSSQDTLEQDISNLGLAVEAPAIEESAVANPSTAPDGSTVEDQIRVLLNPVETTIISSEISARVRKYPFEVGDAFNKGDLLASFYCGEVYADRKIIEARQLQAQITVDSNRSMLSSGGVSKFELDLSEAQLAETAAELDKNTVQQRQCAVYAPYSGKVVAVFTGHYQSVGSGEPIIEVIDDSKLEMILHVPSEWVTRLKSGDTFRIAIDETGGEYESVIRKINPRIDPSSKTLELHARLNDSHGDLKAGMSGNALFDSGE